MSRKPRGNRPPRLDDVPRPEPSPRVDDTAAPEARLARALAERRVAGPHARLGRAEVDVLLTRLAADHVDATLGLVLGGVTREEAADALAAVWGAPERGARMLIDPARTTEAARAAATRLAEVAARGGRVALATSRPASLLACYAEVATTLAGAGARLVDVGVYGPIGQSRALWWVGGVAVLTDGGSLLADPHGSAGDDWLFAVGRPDLVVADRGFAAAAVGAGVETIALADLDAVVLGVAARRGRRVQVVPLDEQRPPGAYQHLVGALTADLQGA